MLPMIAGTETVAVPETNIGTPNAIPSRQSILLKFKPVEDPRIEEHTKIAKKIKVYQKGVASWYGKENRIASNGKRLHNNIPAAAHKTLPIGSKIKITNTKTKRSVVAVVVDRGPYIKNRIVDVNLLAATQLGMVKCGTTLVTIQKLNE
jgi:rare lipoprotein A